MLQIHVNLRTLLLVWAFLKEGMAQDGNTNESSCGQSNILLGTDTKEFNIPPNGAFTEPVICRYSITGPPYTEIDYDLTNMNVGTKHNCDTEYLSISSSPKDAIRSKICGNKTSGVSLTSGNNTAYIVLHLEHGNPAGDFVRGFLKATPLENNVPCGTRFLTLGSSSAELRIPQTGKEFDAPALCIYNIKGNDNERLSFNVTNIRLGSDGPCEKDFLKAADTVDEIDNTTFVVCGTQPSKTVFNSATNEMFVLMVTSTSPKNTFVNAIYKKVESTPDVPTNEPSCGESNIVLGSSGMEFNIPVKGTFTNPINCTYTITSPTSTTISYNITSIHVGNGPDCETDFLVFASSLDSLRTARKICGTTIPTDLPKSTSNKAFITLNLGTSHPEGAFVKGLLSVENSSPHLVYSFVLVFQALTFMWVH